GPLQEGTGRRVPPFVPRGSLQLKSRKNRKMIGGHPGHAGSDTVLFKNAHRPIAIDAIDLPQRGVGWEGPPGAALAVLLRACLPEARAVEGPAQAVVKVVGIPEHDGRRVRMAAQKARLKNRLDLTAALEARQA